MTVKTGYLDKSGMFAKPTPSTAAFSRIANWIMSQETKLN